MSHSALPPLQSQEKNSKPRKRWALPCLFAFLVLCAFLQLHIRIETTLLGYEIAGLKETEAKYLKTRSRLSMEWAQISAKRHLRGLVSGTTDGSVANVNRDHSNPFLARG